MNAHMHHHQAAGAPSGSVSSRSRVPGAITARSDYSRSAKGSVSSTASGNSRKRSFNPGFRQR